MALHQHEGPNSGVVARPTGFGRFQAEIAVRGGTILADEPAEVGGGGTGRRLMSCSRPRSRPARR